eukprot:TRINITY_DN1889_c0_g1_i1.p4 TRINITY_DN1889_c0_g1~~TRINITY_DN1889_c0_g1_i1.p4  ORF type:complete len:113 (-),score=21.38 TRINITY_DN1889_c0_g1_i1:1335-1673(-)
MRGRKSHPGCRRSWDLIVPVHLGSSQVCLLFYDRSAGEIEVYEVNQAGELHRARLPGCRHTWHSISPLRVGGYQYLIFYDNHHGHGEIYRLTEHGHLEAKGSDHGWRKTWTQ